MNAPAIGLALFGGFLFAFGAVLQQKGAMEEPEASALRADFLLRLLRRPIWLVGLIVDAAGYVAQAAALGLGSSSSSSRCSSRASSSPFHSGSG